MLPSDKPDQEESKDPQVQQHIQPQEAEEEESKEEVKDVEMIDTEHKLEKDCCVCMQIMVEPARLPCNHLFCIQCLNKYFESKFECPMCRAAVPVQFEPEIDEQLQSKIKADHLKEYSARRKDLSDKKLLAGDMESIIITFGNKHELCPAAGYHENTHKWTMLVRLNTKKDNKPLPANKFFEKVRYGLHETFGAPHMDVRANQDGKFEMTFKGWGTF